MTLSALIAPTLTPLGLVLPAQKKFYIIGFVSFSEALQNLLQKPRFKLQTSA